MLPGCGNRESSETNGIMWLSCRSLGFWNPLLILESVLCSWLAAVPGQPPRLSRLPVPNSGMWVTLCPHNGESSPKGKGFQPKAAGGGLRAPVTELIPKTKSFPPG